MTCQDKILLGGCGRAYLDDVQNNDRSGTLYSLPPGFGEEDFELWLVSFNNSPGTKESHDSRHSPEAQNMMVIRPFS